METPAIMSGEPWVTPFIWGMVIGVLLINYLPMTLLTRLIIWLGLRSKCCGAPTESYGYKREYCTKCDKKDCA